MGAQGFIFVVSFFVLLVLSFVRHPRFGLYAYMLAYYVHPPSRWWGDALPDLRWSLLAAFVTVVSLWLKKKPENPRVGWTKTYLARVLMVFTVWIWIQNLWALSPVKHMDMCVLYAKFLIVFYMFYTLADSYEEIVRILLVHIGGCFFLGYIAFGMDVSGRLDGVGGPDIAEANAFAMQMSTAVMCGAMLVLVNRTWRLAFCVIAMPFILNGIVLAGSRGAFLSMIAGGFVLTRMKPAQHRTLFYVLASLGVSLMLFVASESFLKRMLSIEDAAAQNQQMDISAESRYGVAEAQLKMAAKYPFGTGHRGTEVLSREYLDEKYLMREADGSYGQRSSHNTFLSAWVEQGFIGAILYWCIVLWCFYACGQLRKRYAKQLPEVAALGAAVAAALMVFLIAGIFVDYLKAEVQFWLYALLSAMFYMDKKSKTVPSTAPNSVAVQ